MDEVAWSRGFHPCSSTFPIALRELSQCNTDASGRVDWELGNFFSLAHMRMGSPLKNDLVSQPALGRVNISDARHASVLIQISGISFPLGFLVLLVWVVVVLCTTIISAQAFLTCVIALSIYGLNSRSYWARYMWLTTSLGVGQLLIQKRNLGFKLQQWPYSSNESTAIM